MSKISKSNQFANKRGNNRVDIDDFKQRLEHVTGYKKQHDIEEEADLPFNALTKIYGRQQALTVDTLLALSKTYGVSIDYLLGNDLNENRENNLNVADFIEMIHALHNIGAIKLQPKATWTATLDYYGHPETVKVSSSAILIANINLESIMQDYMQLKKGMEVIEDSSLSKEVYDRFVNARRESNVSIKGATIPEDELIKEMCGYYD